MYSYYTSDDSVNLTKRTKRFIGDTGNPTAPLDDMLVFKRDMNYKHPALADGVYLPDTRYDSSIKEISRFERPRIYNVSGISPKMYSETFERSIGVDSPHGKFSYENPYGLPVHGSTQWGGELGLNQCPSCDNTPLGDTLIKNYKDSINVLSENQNNSVKRYLSKRGVQALSNRKQRYEMRHYRLKKPNFIQ